MMGIVDNLKVLTGKKEAVEKTQVAAKKVLIVDDEIALAEALAARFRDDGYEVYTADNGKSGLELAISKNPDIILLDLIMPIMDGKAMLKKLRDIPQFKGLPVIVLTNAGDIDNVRETQLYLNAIEFLVKSNVSMEDIVAKVKEKI